MRLQFQSGSAEISAPLVMSSLHSAMKTILRTLDAKFQSIKTEIPQVRRGFGIAAALSDLATGTGLHLKRVEREMEQAQREIQQEIDRAKSVIDAADRYSDLLASCAEHVKEGAPIRHESVAPDLADAARLMRRSYLLGDPDGLAKKTAAVLQTESEEAAASIATAADMVRRIGASVKVAIFKQKRDCLERLKASAAAPLAIVSDSEKAAINNAARSEDIHYNGFRDGFLKTYREKGAYIRPPNLKCLTRLQGRINRNSKGVYTILKGAVQ